MSGRLGKISSYSESDSVAESLTAQKSDEQEKIATGHPTSHVGLWSLMAPTFLPV